MSLLLKAIGAMVALSIIPCLLLVVRKHLILSQAEQCRGVVVGHEPHNDSDGTTYGLKIEYRDRRGISHTFATGSASNPPAKPVGEKVTVFHHADGSKPDVLVFEHLYFGYWLWFCLSLGAAGWLLAPMVLEILYPLSP